MLFGVIWKKLAGLFWNKKKNSRKTSAVFSLLLLFCFERVTVNALGNCGLCLVSSDFNLIESAVVFALAVVLTLLYCAMTGLIGCVIHIFHLQN